MKKRERKKGKKKRREKTNGGDVIIVTREYLERNVLSKLYWCYVFTTTNKHNRYL